MTQAPVRQGGISVALNGPRDPGCCSEGKDRHCRLFSWPPLSAGSPPRMGGHGCDLGCSGLGEAARPFSLSGICWWPRPSGPSSPDPRRMAGVPPRALSSPLKTARLSSCLLGTFNSLESMGCFEHLVESGADICDGLRWPSGPPVWKRPRGLLGQRVVSSPLSPYITPASPHPFFMAGVSVPEDRAPLMSPFLSPCPLRHPLPSLGFCWAIICPPSGRGAQACVRVTHPHPPTAGPPSPPLFITIFLYLSGPSKSSLFPPSFSSSCP